MAALGPDFAALPVSYPTDEPLGYGALEERLGTGLPSDAPYLLLAQSRRRCFLCRPPKTAWCRPGPDKPRRGKQDGRWTGFQAARGCFCGCRG